MSAKPRDNWNWNGAKLETPEHLLELNRHLRRQLEMDAPDVIEMGTGKVHKLSGSEPIHPFGLPCSKCGNYNIALRWTSKRCYRNGGALTTSSEYDFEKLINICRNCDYGWLSLCKDAG
jgi:hypothetical protein